MIFKTQKQDPVFLMVGYGGSNWMFRFKEFVAQEETALKNWAGSIIQVENFDEIMAVLGFIGWGKV